MNPARLWFPPTEPSGIGCDLRVDNTLATAMIDRLMHHGEAIVIQGEFIA
jgi:hypothetical protein